KPRNLAQIDINLVIGNTHRFGGHDVKSHEIRQYDPGWTAGEHPSDLQNHVSVAVDGLCQRRDHRLGFGEIVVGELIEQLYEAVSLRGDAIGRLHGDGVIEQRTVKQVDIAKIGERRQEDSIAGLIISLQLETCKVD